MFQVLTYGQLRKTRQERGRNTFLKKITAKNFPRQKKHIKLQIQEVMTIKQNKYKENNT